MALPDPKRRMPGKIPPRPLIKEPVASPTPPGSPPQDSPAPSSPPRARRRVVARRSSSGSDGIERIFIRFGVIAALGLIAFIGHAVTAKPAGDQRYWDAAVTMTQSLDKQILVSRESLRRQVDALPIAGVSDPKLKEFHALMLQMLSAPVSDNGPDGALLSRFDNLIDELNRKYAH